MTVSTSKIMFERKPRYTIRDGQTVTVVVERDSQSDHPPVTANLIDISETGAKLSTASTFPIGERVKLKLAMDELETGFSSTAEICWSRPDEGEDWLVACTFRPQITVNVLDMLVNCELLERRREPERRRMCLPATVRWELGESADSAELQDYSDGGFCISTNYTAAPGQRLTMRCEAPDGDQLEIRANVNWILRFPEDYLVGCSIAPEQDISCLRALEC